MGEASGVACSKSGEEGREDGKEDSKGKEGEQARLWDLRKGNGHQRMRKEGWEKDIRRAGSAKVKSKRKKARSRAEGQLTPSLSSPLPPPTAASSPPRAFPRSSYRRHRRRCDSKPGPSS
jgi:hypothetical protein